MTHNAADWRNALNPDWIVPDWPAPERVRSVCTTRAGGISTGPFASLNLGDRVGDNAEQVDANRMLLRQATTRTVFLRQMHGYTVLPLDPAVASHHEADAAFTRLPGMACTVMVADCLPVLLTRTDGSAVAAAHAGWRGLAGEAGHGVLEAVMATFKPSSGVPSAGNAPDVIAWLGPCIGPGAFEVGDEVHTAFCQTDPASSRCFQAGPTAGKWRADLAGLARLRLQAMGISGIYGNDSSPGWCTFSNPSRFFSYRRDQITLGGSGRFAASIWMV